MGGGGNILAGDLNQQAHTQGGETTATIAGDNTRRLIDGLPIRSAPFKTSPPNPHANKTTNM